MAEAENGSTAPLETPFEPLRWIGTYKILKGVLSIIAGLLVLRVMHRGLPDIADRWMVRLHIEPQSALGQIILHRIVGIKRASLGWLAIGLFAYTPLTCIEGIGLLLRKVWAEWITLFTTAGLIPLEIHEIIRKPTGLRILMLVLNVMVLIYLIVRLHRDRLRRKRLAAPPAPATDSAQSTNPQPPDHQSNVPG
jgi:uncharacterized membrane protein (DUF2068 family)